MVGRDMMHWIRRQVIFVSDLLLMLPTIVYVMAGFVLGLIFDKQLIAAVLWLRDLF